MIFGTIKDYLFGVILIGIIIIAVYFVKKERQIGYQQAVAEYTKKALIAENAARETESRWNRKLQEAQNASAIRDRQIQTLSVALATASDRLRDKTVTVKNNLPKASPDAIYQTADTALTVLTECQIRYGEMAEIADRHASDVKTLMDAWPHESD